MKNEAEQMKIAQDIKDIIDIGEKIARNAAVTASHDMTKMIRNNTSPEAKALALEHHALHIGIGTMFMQKIAPIAEEMMDDLMKCNSDDSEARVLVGIWLAKVFMQIEKEVKTLKDNQAK